MAVTFLTNEDREELEQEINRLSDELKNLSPAVRVSDSVHKAGKRF